MNADELRARIREQFEAWWESESPHASHDKETAWAAWDAAVNRCRFEMEVAFDSGNANGEVAAYHNRAEMAYVLALHHKGQLAYPMPERLKFESENQYLELERRYESETGTVHLKAVTSDDWPNPKFQDVLPRK